MNAGGSMDRRRLNDGACAGAQAVDDWAQRRYFSPLVGVQRTPAENVGW